MLTFDQNTSAKGLALELTFKVADDAKEGEYEIGFDAIITKMDGIVEKSLEAVVSAGKLTIQSFVRGDVNADEQVNTNDAIYLLRHVLYPSKFPINQRGDMNGDAQTNTNDAIYLLRHVLYPAKFPLY